MQKILHRFNMVEIVLAIGVVAFGITGVMALIPPALNAMKNVSYDTFMDEAASKIQWLIKYVNVSNIADYNTSYENDVLKNINNTDYQKQKNELGGDTKIYQMINNKLYYIVSEDGMTGVHVNVWKMPIQDLHEKQSADNGVNVSSGYKTVDTAKGVRIYFCVSWPVTSSWKERTKRYIVYDHFVNN